MATPGGASTDLINVHTPESVISVDNMMKQRVELKEKLSSLLDSSTLQNPKKMYLKNVKKKHVLRTCKKT